MRVFPSHRSGVAHLAHTASVDWLEISAGSASGTPLGAGVCRSLVIATVLLPHLSSAVVASSRARECPRSAEFRIVVPVRSLAPPTPPCPAERQSRVSVELLRTHPCALDDAAAGVCMQADAGDCAFQGILSAILWVTRSSFGSLSGHHRGTTLGVKPGHLERRNAGVTLRLGSSDDTAAGGTVGAFMSGNL